jgi:predicted alpha/beta hydrolase
MRAALTAGAALAVALAAALALAGTALAEPAVERARVSRRKVTAADGAALALYRRMPASGGDARPAVLLVPDLGFGRECFDLDGEGLAPYLGARGRDTFVAELRGQGAADAPAGWTLSDWAAVDLPAAVEAVRAAHPGPVDLVVHGYGGALALMAAPRELKGQLRRVVALSPAVAPEVPNPAVEALLSSGGALSRTVVEGSHEMLFTRDGVFASRRLSSLRKAPPRDLGATAAAELLAWMRSGDLTLNGARGRERLEALQLPVLVFLPILDNYAHPEFAAPLRELAPRASVRLRTLSRLYLHREDYTHLSMLHGKGAEADVFAPIVEFLDAPDAPDAPGAPDHAGASR